MAVQVFAIDPDVWIASATDPRCQVALLDIWTHPKKQNERAVALDGADVEREYIQLLTSSSLDNSLKKILQDIFNQRERNPRVRVISSHMSADLQSVIARHCCYTPVEPALIAMAASPDEPAMTLLLVGEDTIRPRGLHRKGADKIFRRFFRGHLRKSFSLQLATQIGLPTKDEMVAGLHTRVFEDQVRGILMQRAYHKYGIAPFFERKTPSQVYHYRDSEGVEAAEIDCYIYLDVNGTRYVWIAECELREEGNEGQPTTKDKVEKLARRVEAAQAFEVKRTDLFVEAKGYLVTNAKSLLPRAESTVTTHNLQFVSVIMPENWTPDMHWTLPEQDFPSCDL
ncbi:MAG: hypothetical protein WBE17_04070 [Anaerolineae bacterium]